LEGGSATSSTQKAWSMTTLPRQMTTGREGERLMRGRIRPSRPPRQADIACPPWLQARILHLGAGGDGARQARGAARLGPERGEPGGVAAGAAPGQAAGSAAGAPAGRRHLGLPCARADGADARAAQRPVRGAAGGQALLGRGPRDAAGRGGGGGRAAAEGEQRGAGLAYGGTPGRARRPAPPGGCSGARRGWPGSSCGRRRGGPTSCGSTARISAARSWATRSTVPAAVAGCTCWPARWPCRSTRAGGGGAGAGAHAGGGRGLRGVGVFRGGAPFGCTPECRCLADCGRSRRRARPRKGECPAAPPS
jgi:hypothetical protein